MRRRGTPVGRRIRPAGRRSPGGSLWLLLGGVTLVLQAPAAAAWGGTLPHADVAPPGHTGGFGEPTCQVCHAEWELNAPGGALRLAGVPDPYEPGGRYALTVDLEAPGTDRAGFQVAARFAEGELEGRQAGTLASVGPRVRVVTPPESAVQYAQHGAGGTDVAAPDRASWTFEWTAPDTLAPVVFHLVGNAANGDNSPFGDLILATEIRTGS